MREDAQHAAPPPDGAGELPAPALSWAATDPLAAVAHELRGLVQALTLSAEVLDEELKEIETPRLRSLVAGIRRRALWLQCLVENLLAAGSLRHGRLPLRREVVDVAALLSDLAVAVEPLLGQQEQQFRVQEAQVRGRRGDHLDQDARTSRAMVLADPVRLGQVLLNLLLNASKFGPRGRPIDVTVDLPSALPPDVSPDVPADVLPDGVAELAMPRRPPDPAGGAPAAPAWVRVAVADRGPGLPRDHARNPRRLFEPFFQANLGGAAKAGREGLGIGLALVHTIVAAHGGRVGAHNRAGGGACFWIALPLVGKPATMGVR